MGKTLSRCRRLLLPVLQARSSFLRQTTPVPPAAARAPTAQLTDKPATACATKAPTAESVDRPGKASAEAPTTDVHAAEVRVSGEPEYENWRLEAKPNPPTAHRYHTPFITPPPAWRMAAKLQPLLPHPLPPSWSVIAKSPTTKRYHTPFIIPLLAWSVAAKLLCDHCYHSHYSCITPPRVHSYQPGDALYPSPKQSLPVSPGYVVYHPPGVYNTPGGKFFLAIKIHHHIRYSVSSSSSSAAVVDIKSATVARLVLCRVL